MQNASTWQPSKFVMGPNGLQTTSNSREVAISSRTAADLAARFYGEMLPRHARGRLLDLGCGNVPLYEAYRDLVDEITCVDWPNSKHRVQHIDVCQDISKPLELESDTYDTIILSDVLEHLPKPELLWSEMARVLSPGGTLIMNVPFMYWLHEEPHDFYRYTEFALRNFAEAARFEVLLLAPLGGALHIMADTLAKLLVMYKFNKSAALTYRVSERIIRSRLGDKITRRTASKLPLGYGMVARLRG